MTRAASYGDGVEAKSPDTTTIAHVGDLHLGRRWLSVQDPSGVNQREADVYRMAEGLAERLIDERPDVAIVAGDLFDSANPSTRARSAAFRLVGDLRSEKIDVFIVAGNHDHAQSSTPSPLIHLDEFFGCALALEQTHFDVPGVRFHMLPYQALAGLSAGTELAKFDLLTSGRNVLVSHAYVSHPDLGSAPERVQLPLALAEDPAFDLVLLGHIHQHRRLGERIYYCGALERLNIGEIDAPTGLWLHELHRDGTHVSRSVPLADLGVAGLPRPMRMVNVTHAGCGLDELHQRVMGALAEQTTPGSVIQVRVRDADPDLRQSAHPRMWREEAARLGVIHAEVQLRSRPLEETLNAELAPLPSRLDEGYRDYLTANERPDLVELALETLAEVNR